FVAHTDSRFDSGMLLRYVRAYQEVQPLTIGELWAVSITLRIVLIENLRRLAEQMVHGRMARQQADGLADRLLGAGGRAGDQISDVDWKELFEHLSLVDEALAAGSAFKDMDFPTRNLYRSAIEDLARGSSRTELDIARNAVLAARQVGASCSAGAGGRRGDP